MPASAIIVPSFNRPAQLTECLKSLMKQDDDDMEVIVVDDGSPTPLAPICEAFGARVRCIRQENCGPAIARNTGVAATQAEFIAFTDDDCRPRPDWLRRLRQAHGGDDSVQVGGRVENGLPQDRYASASQALCSYIYEYFGEKQGAVQYFTSNNIAVSRAGFNRLGGFDRTFNRAAAEDRDFGIRWREQGGRLVYVPDAVIDHYHAMTLRKYWRQHTNYGAGAHHLHNVMKRRNARTPRFETVRFYAGMMLWPIRNLGLMRADISLLIALSQVAMVNGYFEAKREGRPEPE